MSAKVVDIYLTISQLGKLSTTIYLHLGEHLLLKNPLDNSISFGSTSPMDIPLIHWINNYYTLENAVGFGGTKYNV